MRRNNGDVDDIERQLSPTTPITIKILSVYRSRVLVICLIILLLFSTIIMYSLLSRNDDIEKKKTTTTTTRNNSHVSLRDYELKFVVVGDHGRRGEHNQKNVAQQMAKTCARHCSFMLSPGDNFYPVGVTSVDQDDFAESFEKVYDFPSLQIPFFTVLGNHDYYTLASPATQSLYSTVKGLLASPRGRFYLDDKRYYFVDVYLVSEPGNPGVVHSVLNVNDKIELGDVPLPKNAEHSLYLARFVFIDTVPLLGHDQSGIKEDKIYPHSFSPEDIAEQQKWIQTVLASNTPLWKIVIGHHPVYSFGWHSDNVEIAYLQQLFESTSVTAYIAGHDHIMQHVVDNSKNKSQRQYVNHFVSGAGSKVEGDNNFKSEKSLALFDSIFYHGKTSGFMSVSLTAKNMKVNFIDHTGEDLYTTTIVNSK
jgi:tartrate-resistant acid phosphatase type 5